MNVVFMKLLMGDHLSETSNTIQWIHVEKSDNRKVRVKKYKELQHLAESDPNSNDMYEANFLYPNRPASLNDVCLFDFVKWHCRGNNDTDGRRQYVSLEKPKIPNHRIYDPNKPDE